MKNFIFSLLAFYTYINCGMAYYSKVINKEKKITLAYNLNENEPRNAVEDYIESYRNLAISSMRKYCIPASITLAQGILESGIGKGNLAKNANNHFGIKCKKEWKGDYTYHTDDKPNECFRKYDTVEDSYEDHALFLYSRSHYDFLFNLEITDYKGWAKGLRKAGYALDKKYPSKLIRIIEKYELYQFDVYAPNTSDTIDDYDTDYGETDIIEVAPKHEDIINDNFVSDYWETNFNEDTLEHEEIINNHFIPAYWETSINEEIPEYAETNNGYFTADYWETNNSDFNYLENDSLDEFGLTEKKYAFIQIEVIQNP